MSDGADMKIKAMVAVAMLAFGFCATQAQSSGTTTIHIRWTETFDRLEPNPKQGITLDSQIDVTLHKGGDVTNFRSATDVRRDETYTFDRVTDKMGGRWKVSGPHSLISTRVFPNSSRTFRVQISGRSCSVSIQNVLKPGAPYFVLPMVSRPGKAGHYTNMYFSNIGCSIE